MDDFFAQLSKDASACEKYLGTLLESSQDPESRLCEAMAYSLLGGGKRIRAALAFGAARMALGLNEGSHPSEAMLRTAAALECMHAYSLVHDDLPAMDDSATRRGQPSCHVKFNEATAILAGDALQTMAFEILADPRTHIDANVRIQLITVLAKASGFQGMAGGQMLDLEGEIRQFNYDEMQKMQMMKTGALLSCAVLCGGIVGGASTEMLAAQKAFARNLGVAFQIADDLLDYTGDANVMGKPSRQDLASGKSGFVSLIGIEAAKRVAQNLIDEANAALMPWKNRAIYMNKIATFAITRNS